jgi:hypothetical protein
MQNEKSSPPAKEFFPRGQVHYGFLGGTVIYQTSEVMHVWFAEEVFNER